MTSEERLPVKPEMRGDPGGAEGPPGEEPMQRREFLDLVLAGCAAAGGLTAAGIAVLYLSPPEKKMNGTGPVEVAEADDISVNAGRVVAFGAEKVLLVHTDDGFVALSAVCPHAGCLVTWDAETKRVKCPCHDGYFDTKGNVLAGPPPSPLKAFRAEVKDGKVVVGNV